MNAESLEERIKYLEDEAEGRMLDKLFAMQRNTDIFFMSMIAVTVGVTAFLAGFKLGGGFL
jgi:hypothetical protein